MSEEPKSLLLEFFGDTPLFRIMDFLLDNRLRDFSKKEIAEGSDVSWATLFKYWGRLERRGIVKPTRRVGNITLYQLNEREPLVKEIKRMEILLMGRAEEQAVESAKVKVVARQR